MDAPERPLWLIWLRRIGVVLAGGTVLIIGIAMIVLPGPAIVMIPVGLAILGLEFAWARRWLRKARARGRLLARRRKRSR
jgi:tellurite resistance protein TerC